MKFAVISEIKNHKLRAIKTLSTCLAYMVVGVQSSIIGVALLDLQVLSGASLDSITFLVTGRCVGHALGSVVAGLIENKLHPQLIIFYALLISAASNIAMPLPISIYGMVLAFGISGFSGGVTDNGMYTILFTTKINSVNDENFSSCIHFPN